MIALGDYLEAHCHACIGGTVVREDIARLSEGVHVVVGTPGRVFDMINRGALSKCFRLVKSCLPKSTTLNFVSLVAVNGK